jgi:hypothetical protein
MLYLLSNLLKRSSISVEDLDSKTSDELVDIIKKSSLNSSVSNEAMRILRKRVDDKIKLIYQSTHNKNVHPSSKSVQPIKKTLCRKKVAIMHRRLHHV